MSDDSQDLDRLWAPIKPKEAVIYPMWPSNACWKNPANRPDDAADVTDSVPRYDES